MSSSIFPSNVYLDSKSKDIQSRMQTFYDSSMSLNSQWQEEARTDALIEAGDQAALNSLGFNRVLPYMDMYTSNKVKRIVSLVSGIQRIDRKSTVTVPLEGSDQQTSDQFSKLIFNINTNHGVLDVISDAFQSSLVTGLTLLQVWIDYRDDPISGTIKVDLCPYNTFLIDPNFKKRDLSDCSTIWKRAYITEAECKSFLPQHSKEISDIAKSSVGTDDLFPYMSVETINNLHLLAYDEFYYKDTRTKQILRDSSTGLSTEYNGQDEEMLPMILKQNPSIILEELEVPTVKMAILVNGKVFYDGLNPMGTDDYPFVPIFCYLNQQVNEMELKFQGLVRGMRDSQFLFNLMTSLEVEYIQSRVNPSVIYKPTSLVDPKVVERRDLTGGVAVRKNSSMDDIRFNNPMEIPQSVTLIREQVAKEMVENDGGNEELLGSADNDNLAGVLSALRQTSGKVILQPLMDGLDRAQKILGDRLISLIQCNYTPGKVARIIEEEPTQEFYNKTFGLYDAAVEQGVNTTTQRQQQFATMVALRNPSGPNVQLTDEDLIKASSLQNKNDIIERMKESAKAQQEAQQKETEVNQLLQQAEIELAKAKANSDNATALERTSRVNDNRTQAIANLAEANKDDEQAALDKVKALKELEGIDLAHLEKLIALSNMVKENELREKQALEDKDAQAAQQEQALQPQPMQPQPMQEQPQPMPNEEGV